MLLLNALGVLQNLNFLSAFTNFGKLRIALISCIIHTAGFVGEMRNELTFI